MPLRGRKKGQVQAVSELARIEAAKEGILPHEWMLKIVRGEPIKQRVMEVTVDEDGVETREWVEHEVYPDFATRVDCAKAAAPFYAPKLAAQTVSLKGGVSLSNVSGLGAGEMKQLIKLLGSKVGK